MNNQPIYFRGQYIVEAIIADLAVNPYTQGFWTGADVSKAQFFSRILFTFSRRYRKMYPIKFSEMPSAWENQRRGRGAATALLSGSKIRPLPNVYLERHNRT